MVFHRIISNYVRLAQPAIHIAWLEIKTSLANGVVFVSSSAISSVRKDGNIITLRRMNFWFPETLFSKKTVFPFAKSTSADYELVWSHNMQ